MVNSADSLDRIFGALSDPTRRRIIERLSRRRLTVGEIASEFDISQPAISKHVRVLEDSGLLQREVVGRAHFCSLSPAAMESVSAWLEKQRAYWNASLDRLDDVLANRQTKRK